MKTWSLFGFLALFAVIGALLAGLLFYLFGDGLLVRWERMGQTPDSSANLILAGDGNRAYILDARNQVFSCSPINSRECWIPDVPAHSSDWQQMPCSSRRLMFSPFSNAPRDIHTCIYATYIRLDSLNESAYAIDSEGVLWRWRYESSANSILLLPLVLLLGGLFGALAASVIWAVNRVRTRGQLSTGEKLFSTTHIILLTLPWLFLIGGFLLISTLFRPLWFEKPQLSVITTQAAETVTAGMADRNKAWQSAATPVPGLTHYRFADVLCTATWETSKSIKVPCSEEPALAELSVSRMENPLINDLEQGGEGLLVRIPSQAKKVSGEYPIVEIQDGDHFRVTVGCLDESIECDAIFELSYLEEDWYWTSLGRWQVSAENPMQEIEMDLSSLAGKKVRISLDASRSSFEGEDMSLIWLDPRIEQK